jgi:hypothetical protein
VEVPLNATAAQLLVKLCADLGTDEPAGVIARALGLLELALSARRGGRRLAIVDASGHMTDVLP